MMEGSGFDQRYQFAGAVRPYAVRRRPLGVARLLGVAVLALVGLSAVGGAIGGLSLTTSRVVSLTREAGPTEQTRRFMAIQRPRH